MPASAIVYFSKFLSIVPSSEKAEQVREQIPVLRDILTKVAAGEDIDDLSNLQRLAWTEQTLMWLGGGRLKEVLSVTRKHLDRFPSDTRARNNRAEALFRSGMWEEALTELEKSLVDDPSNFYSVACSCRIHFLRGMTTKSDAEAQRLEMMSPRQASDLTKAAEAFAFRGDDRRVLAQFDRLQEEGWVDDSPMDSALLYHFAAVVSARSGDLNLAKMRWKQSLEFASLDLAKDNLDDLTKPVSDRSGSYCFPLNYWFDDTQLKEIVEISSNFWNTDFNGDRERTFAQENAVIQTLQRKYPFVEKLIPALLDRSDRVGQMMAVGLGCRMGSEVVRQAILAFSESERGSDSLRYDSALQLKRRGLLPVGEIVLFISGKPTRVEILDFLITDEPKVSPGRSPKVERLAEDAFHALFEGRGKVAETKLRLATELEPDAPDLWNNLAMALLMQDREKEFEAICEMVSQRWPDYFFGRVTFANRLVKSRQYEEALEILNALQHRGTFHRTEFTALSKSFAKYFMSRNEQSSAIRWIEMLEQVSPDDLDIPRLRSLAAPKRSVNPFRW